jgi:hypothetical protein
LRPVFATMNTGPQLPLDTVVEGEGLPSLGRHPDLGLPVAKGTASQRTEISMLRVTFLESR